MAEAIRPSLRLDSGATASPYKVIERQETNTSSTSNSSSSNLNPLDKSNSSGSSGNNNNNNNNKATDETLSTANCDDSITVSESVMSTATEKQSACSSPPWLEGSHQPPVASVNFDTRNVRQRLREQEAKINALLHSNINNNNNYNYNNNNNKNSISKYYSHNGGGVASSSSSTIGTTNTSRSKANSSPPAAAILSSSAAASDGVLLKLVKTLEDDLKKTEAEKETLQEALDKLKLEKEGKTEQEEEEEEKEEEEKEEIKVEDVRKKEESVVAEAATASVPVTTTKTTLDTSSSFERIKLLELELRQKTYHISLLHERWETTLRRMVQYQCDLELHDLHYTDYAAQQEEAGKETMAELRELTSKSQPKQTRELGKQAKRMMSTLLNDLEGLGERYQETRVAHEQKIEELRRENIEWYKRVQVLEAKLQQQQQKQQAGTTDVVKADNNDDDQTLQSMSGPLMKFREKLRLQQAAAQQSQEQMAAEIKTAKWEKQQAIVEKEVLYHEVERLQGTVSKLQQLVKDQQQQAVLAAQKMQLQQKQHQSELLAAQNSQKKKKGFFSLGKKKNRTPGPVAPPAAAADSPPPLSVMDIEAAMAPVRGETKRFDMVHEQIKVQSEAVKAMQADCIIQRRQKAQLEQTLADLRVSQEHIKAEQESEALLELRAQMNELQAEREEEQRQAMAAIAELQERLANASS